MRVGIFSESYEPLLNGVAVSVGTLTKELRRLGHGVHIFATTCKGEYDANRDVTRLPAVFTRFEPDYPVPIPFVPGLTRRVRREKLDLIHTQTPWILGWLGFAMGRRLRIPVVSTNHTQYADYAHYFPLAPRSFVRSFIAWTMRAYYNRCASVIVPSNPTAVLLREYGVRTPIYTIPTGNSLDTSRDPEARARIRTELGISPDEVVLTYVGRLAKEKNLELLLHSFENLCKRHDDITLLVVGGGPFDDECRRKASALSCSSKVKFAGFMPREKVAKYYSAGDLFTFPSTTETQGLVLGEALQAGLPCVAVNAGGSPEMLKDGDDSLLTENSVDDFSAKIDILLSDRNLMARFSEQAVVNAARFSPRGMAASMLEVYEKVLQSSRDAQ
ncbi:MAG TPA: glycosyltransferase family 4 protein [Armatimonadota bacterium]|jgi:glycosyltransferase involved in cell wall biosynthesis